MPAVNTLKYFDALQNINYDTLQLNKHLLPHEAPKPVGPSSLVELSCRFIGKQRKEFCCEVLDVVPTVLAEPLLREAMINGYNDAVSTYIANWPLPGLRFKDLLPASMKEVFKEEMGRDLDVFKGVTARTKKCKLKCLDLRGYVLNWTFTKLIVQMWPPLSLKKNQRNVKKLTNLVLKEAELKTDNKLAREIIPRMIRELLAQEMTVHPRFGINMKKGEKMKVLIDRLEFGTQNTFFMDYLLTNCLRAITPVNIITTNIIIKSDLSSDDESLDSLAPFIVFRGHDTPTLEGIWLENLQDNVFFMTHQDLNVFTNLTSLAVPNSNITLQEGKTRRRTATRSMFTSVLSRFTHLVRLDIAQNGFSGCLEEVLESLPADLEYLSLRECDLLDKDVEYLAGSRHAASLREINTTRICGLFPEDTFAVNSSVLIRNLKHFTQLRIADIQQNNITDTRIPALVDVLRHHWPHVKGINMKDNIVGKEAVVQLLHAVMGKKSLQQITVPYAHNLLEAVNVMENGRAEFAAQVSQIVHTSGRTDLDVKIHSLAYAIYVNI